MANVLYGFTFSIGAIGGVIWWIFHRVIAQIIKAETKGNRGIRRKRGSDV